MAPNTTKFVLLVIILNLASVFGGVWAAAGETAAKMASADFNPVAYVVRDEWAAQKDRASVISALAIDEDRSLLVTAGDDHLVRIWDAKTFSLLSRAEGHTDWVCAAAFVPRCQLLVTAGHDGRLILWELDRLSSNGLAVALQAQYQNSEALRALALSPDGHLAAVGHFAGMVTIHEIPSLRLAKNLHSGGNDVRALAFSPDGRYLAAGNRAGNILLWEVNEWTLAAELRGHTRRIRALAFAPAGGRLLSAGEDQKVILWDIQQGRLVTTLKQPANVFALAWWNDEIVLSGGTDNVLRCFRVSTGEEVARLVGHSGTITGLLCRQDLGQVISAGYDTTLRVWTVRLEERIASYPR